MSNSISFDFRTIVKSNVKDIIPKKEITIDLDLALPSIKHLNKLPFDVELLEILTKQFIRNGNQLLTDPDSLMDTLSDLHAFLLSFNSHEYKPVSRPYNTALTTIIYGLAFNAFYNYKDIAGGINGFDNQDIYYFIHSFINQNLSLIHISEPTRPY